MPRKMDADSKIVTVECPQCHRAHTTFFNADEKVRDIICPDCVKQRIEEEQGRILRSDQENRG